MNTLSNKVILTDSKLISKQELVYEKEESLPTLITYVESFPSANNIPDEVPSFLIGSKVVDDQWYEGGVAEIVLYDRLISKKQRQKVESYLSLKYGISLADSLDYFSSDGEKIWEFKNEGKFTKRLTGIGRDEQGGLNQKQSTNLHDDFNLTIALGSLNKLNRDNKSAINDKSYILWADNDKSIDLTKQNFESLEIQTLERNWKFTTLGKGWENQDIEFTIDPTHLDGYDSELAFWVVLDDAQFQNVDDLKNSRLQKCIRNIDGTFSANIQYDSDKSTIGYFTFIQAPEEFVTLDVAPSDCDKFGGDVNLSVFGFSPIDPNYVLKNSTTEIAGKWSNDQNKMNFSKLPFGEYELIDLNSHTSLSQIVTFSKADCEVDFDVAFDLFPNPVQTDELFTIELPTDRKEKIVLEIHDALGRLIRQNKIEPNASHLYQDKILNQGAYTVTLSMGDIQTLRKLIVINE